jgi:aryl-alcohol dehydrogenase-like predicted oxidoreductase
MKPESLIGKLAALKPALKQIQDICQENRIAIGSLALNYVLSKKYIDGVLIGVDSLGQLKQNISWAEESIDPKLMTQVEAIEVFAPELLTPTAWN